MADAGATAAPLMENESVKELLSILRKHTAPQQNGLLAVLNQIAAMEKQLEAAVRELAAMRRGLAEMERQNHPIRNAMQKAVIVMQAHVLELRDKLAALKHSVIEGCKDALAAFKEKGIAALGNLARFFRMRPILESIRTGADKAAQSADKAIAAIGASSAKYHEAGRRIKNAGRALMGKETVTEAKPNGKAAKTVTAPFRAARVCFAEIQKRADAAVRRLQAEHKPPIHEVMRGYKEKISKEARNAPDRKPARSDPEL